MTGTGVCRLVCGVFLCITVCTRMVVTGTCYIFVSDSITTSDADDDGRT